jgi:tetratricopeptide (TPR) repeat protein/transglutaminase-like putative cysteine protease
MTAEAMRSAAAKIAPDNISDATILDEETDYQISETGAMNYTRRLIYRIETPGGVQGWAEASMEWDPWFESPAEIHARVLQTDGTFAELDPKTITDGPVNSAEEDTYVSAHVRKAPLPGIAIGAIVEEVIAVNEKHPYITDGSVYRYIFTNNALTARERVSVEIPASRPFADRVSNAPGLEITRTEKDGVRRVVYEMGTHPATVYGDIDLPSTTMRFPMLEFSTARSWQELAQAYAEIAEPRIVIDEVQAVLPAAMPATRLETIQMLVERLHKEVRYTGVEFNESQFTPQMPAEVLKRHYGDCKDKATLLVTMLRAAKIPAYLALLSGGDGLDVNPELPGLNRFNHAIVYVPAEGKEAALWIDATADSTQVGMLPFEDSDRLALVIEPGAKGLTRTPAATPEDSVLVETRTFKLAELGPSQVVESSETDGYIDASYRARYGGPVTKRTTDELENYAKNAYLAKSLAKVEHGDGADLTKPFQLTLTVADARRGTTSLDDAAVAIFPTGVLFGLPAWITTPATPLPDDATAAQKKERADAEAQRSPTYTIRPFVSEQRYRIYVPAGFSLRALPPDRTTPLGPGSLTEHYAMESPSVVTAELRFTTGKSELTVDEALAMRQAIADVSKRDVITIGFDQTGAKLMADGRIKDGLAADEAAIAQSPDAALPHARLARALLTAGVGDMARKEAERGVELDPSSPAVLTTQGWILQHDLLGNRFGPGFDRAGAIAAYKKAIAAQSEDFDPRFDLAVLYEYDSDGERYAPDANLDEAIALYRTLIAEAMKKNLASLTQDRINLSFALLFNHEYKELDELLPEMQVDANRPALTIAAAAAQKDAAAGIAAANKLNVSADDRNKAMIAAGADLAQMGLYAEASAVLAASNQGGSDAPMIARQVEMYRNLHRVPAKAPAVTSPESAVFAYLNLMMTDGAGGMDKTARAAMAALFSRRAYASDAAFDRNLGKNLDQMGFLQAMANSSGTSEAVLRDVILGSTTLKSTGDDATGYRVVSQTVGSEASHYFVVKEDGTYKLVADEHDAAEVGNLALYALEHNEPALAKSVLDWKREQMHRGGGDDVFSGPLLPRFWTVDSDKPGANSAEAMRVAAISLLAGSMDAKPYLESVAALREKATGEHQMDFDLLLAYAYDGVEDAKPALKYAKNLLEEEPDSETAMHLAAQAYALEGDTKDWSAMLAPHVARHGDDPDVLRDEVSLLDSEHKYGDARATEKKIFDSGKADGSDYNSYAWLGLFDDSLGADITSAAQQSNMISRNGNFASLHTLACIYAAQGKVTDAQQVLTQAMTAANMAKPNSEVWYALGRLYEDYGLRDAALAAYKRVEAHEWDDHAYIDPMSTYLLAQARIASLGAGGAAAR